MSDRDQPPIPIEWEPLRRAAKKVGRNDPCPCGSGKKYKKCCEAKDAERLADPSPFAGLTKAEAFEDPGKHGDPRIVDAMTPEQVASASPAKMGSAQLAALAIRAAQEKLWPQAAAALDALATKDDEVGRDAAGYRDDVLHLMVRSGALAEAEAELAKLPDDYGRRAGARLVVLAARRDPATLDQLEALLREDPDAPGAFVDAGFSLRDAGHLALALAVLRATPIDILHEKDVVEVQAEADEIRGELGLPKEDPVLDPAVLDYDRRHPEAEILGYTKKVKKEAEETRAQLDSLRLALGDLHRKRAEAESAIAQAEKRARAAESLKQPGEGGDALKRKLEVLKSELREQQRERAELRDKLRELEAPKRRSPGDAPPEAKDAPEAFDGEELPADRPLRAALFGDAFYDSVRGLDPRVVLKAQETAVRFASYDDAVWHQAKKMRDLPDVFTLRVGLHHRLILRRSSDGGVEVRELVTREAFDGVLRGYRR